ncbi:MAG TPA: amidase [Candidatus Sulfotelmatobacter sp.]|nr:amidase [Candidatus Sulfotelmatobacter sp.]
MLDLPFRSATALAAEIRAKRVGCRELLDRYLARVERFNPTLNAIIAFDLETARQRADAADAALARGEVWGPLHGVPMTIKESFDAVGMPTTWGLPELKDNRPSRDSLAVARFRAAGAVLFGKTNVPVLLADWQSYNPVYGTTNNPWDTSRTPGGSSGGSAAALAAGLTGLEAGSDIGSSIRNPAHYCGVYGHKPTYGICPPRGQALPGNVAASDISVIGPMARSADDLALALDVMAGPDDIDGAGWRLELPAPRRERLADFRVAVMLNDPESEVDQAVQSRLQALADFLARAGAHVSDRARPALDSAAVQRLYIQLLRAATSGRQSDAVFEQNRAIARGLQPDDESYYARMARANVLSHRDWIAANEQRHRMRLAWAEFFRDYDLLLCPAAASTAFPHDHVGERYERTITVNNKRVPTTDQLFWAGYTCLFYLPATAAPIGLAADGLPVGVQIVGPQYGDRSCIGFARLLEREFAAFAPPPGYA